MERDDVDTKVEELLARMTVAEKLGQLMVLSKRTRNTEDFMQKHELGLAVEETNTFQEFAVTQTRLGIPVIFSIDAVHGHALWPGGTVFPSQLGMSCTWSTEIARVTAVECRATGVTWTYSPDVDVARDLRWGRINETFGEDSYLVGVLAAAMVKGYEGDRTGDWVLSCPKHFAGYSQTIGGRDATEAELTRRNLMKTFLPPFRECIPDAEAKQSGFLGASTIMTAYMPIDGTPATQNSWLLKEVLRDSWGFEGFVVTDYGNIHNLINHHRVEESLTAASLSALKCGNDVMMGTSVFKEHAEEAVKEGLLDEKLIDDSCRKVLKAKMQLGLFDNWKVPDDSYEKIGTEQHKKLAFEVAAKSVVLLKNDKNENGVALLPLDKAKVKKIAVLGPNSDAMIDQMGDWTAGGRWSPVTGQVHPRENISTVLDGLRNITQGTHIEIIHDNVCSNTDDSVPLEKLAEVSKLVSEVDVAILVLGDPMLWNGEQRDRANLDLTFGQQQLLRAAHETKTPVILVLVCGKPNCIPWAAQNMPSIVVAFNPGQEGGNAVASVLFGEVNPSGRLTISWPKHVGQLPVYYNDIPGWHTTKYADMEATPDWVFGHGLTYTQFEWSNFKIQNDKLQKSDALCLSLTVKNTGDRDGTELVQVYVSDLLASVSRPTFELKGFKRVDVAKGEEIEIEIKVPVKLLTIVSKDAEWVVEPGSFGLFVGPRFKQWTFESTFEVL